MWPSGWRCDRTINIPCIHLAAIGRLRLSKIQISLLNWCFPFHRGCHKYKEKKRKEEEREEKPRLKHIKDAKYVTHFNLSWFGQKKRGRKAKSKLTISIVPRKKDILYWIHICSKSLIGREFIFHRIDVDMLPWLLETTTMTTIHTYHNKYSQYNYSKHSKNGYSIRWKRSARDFKEYRQSWIKEKISWVLKRRGWGWGE